ncbi:MAG: Lrp/AsnC ligand binding domain-containing protein [Sulfolobales archaeon]|jgi:DNA-binding Lrp family transcriptional regulator|nr:Lrp/AsnC ligand binding domain-containing protein [Desulfurococcaceae archaeon]
MPVAIVLINTEIGSENEVAQILSKIEGVKEVYEVYGIYDIVVKVEAQTHEALREIIINRIRRIPKVKSTTTMLVIEGRVVG